MPTPLIESPDQVESAGRTNRLALNAVIEAAHAKRGFAETATELKSLADQTARAAELIAEMDETA